MKNKEGTTLGDYFRGALKIYSANRLRGPVYYGFIDRVLFDLETKYKNSFIEDVSKNYKEDLVIFSRSEKAWKSHPKDYFALENMVTETGKVFINKEVDWTWCGAMFKPKIIKPILVKSKSLDFSVLTEFILINHCLGGTLKSIEVDWLAWEDPFWAKKDKTFNPAKKFNNKEKTFRLEYCINCLKLFLDYFK